MPFHHHNTRMSPFTTHWEGGFNIPPRISTKNSIQFKISSMTQINTLTSFTVFSTPSFGAQALEIIRFRIRARSAVPTRMIRSAVVQICQKSVYRSNGMSVPQKSAFSRMKNSFFH